ncbi:MAG: hypothetical protein AAGJ87_15835 [Pseudomonadota bacterium]
MTASDKPEAGPAMAVELGGGYGKDARAAVDESVYRPGSGARLNEAMEQRFAEDALSRLKSNLSSRGGPAPSIELTNEKSQALMELLSPPGLGEPLTRALLAGAGRAQIDDDYHRLSVAFAETFAFAPFAASPAAPIMLVGPTGAGKTSSSAKLAKAAMDQGAGAFMMTADVGRAGAIEQIKTYGDSLGADYFIVETPQDVENVLNSHQPTGAVILDTPGVSPFDAGDIAALKSFQEAARAEPVFVLPASGDAEEFIEWAVAFSEFGVKRAIITKFDATKRVGAALCAVHAANLALANVSETAFISEGLIAATPDFLARRFLATKPGRVG